MKKSEHLGLVLTPAEKKAVAVLAGSRGGLSNSALIRCWIHEAARTAGLSLDGQPQVLSKMSEQSDKTKQSALHKCYQLLIELANESEPVDPTVYGQTPSRKIPEPEKREEIKRWFEILVQNQ